MMTRTKRIARFLLRAGVVCAVLKSQQAHLRKKIGKRLVDFFENRDEDIEDVKKEIKDRVGRWVDDLLTPGATCHEKDGGEKGKKG